MRFYTENYITIDPETEEETSHRKIYKSIFAGGVLKIYGELEDSSSTGNLIMNQPFDPRPKQGEFILQDSNGRDIYETLLKQPWDSAEVALNWYESVRGVK